MYIVYTNTNTIASGQPVENLCYTNSMKLQLNVKPLTVNRAWRGGRRFQSKEYVQYEKDISMLLPYAENPEGQDREVIVKYTFYIKNYGRSDAGSFEKCLTDILVKRGYIKDDRYIREITCRKERSPQEYIEIEITPI